jgi:hypothetical protein
MHGFQLKQGISSFLHKKAFQPKQLEGLNFIMVRPAGIEPAHMASEANALSPELRAR